MSKTNSYDYKEVRKNINRAMDKYGVTLSALCYMIEDKFRIEYGTIYSRFRQIMSDDWAPTLSDELLAKYDKLVIRIIDKDLPSLKDEVQKALKYCNGNFDSLCNNISRVARKTRCAASYKNLSKTLKEIIDGRMLNYSQYCFWIRACRAVTLGTSMMVKNI
jgi:hypothetical protein